MTNKLTQEEREILQGLEEILKGEGDVLTPDALVARKRGRPPLAAVKVPVKIRLDSDLLGVLRRSGPGWQTRINDTLRREFMSTSTASTTVYVREHMASDLPDPSTWLTEFGSAMRMPAYVETHNLEACLA
ncbi:BrnA antitoxin family protein [Hydrogenophaga sp.]|uniref:BrnA antitoxin family protein n=1 Tax=Hydrogenophaga sp. TaxID=1904254 RepID=UPI00271791DA|nr:BrnA antitoxin family protein [Hydrogenophaga sp.]MDO9438032.1 BrnA antitoxin family protein [Hydrogenophaga sp.]